MSDITSFVDSVDTFAPPLPPRPAWDPDTVVRFNDHADYFTGALDAPYLIAGDRPFVTVETTPAHRNIGTASRSEGGPDPRKAFLSRFAANFLHLNPGFPEDRLKQLVGRHNAKLSTPLFPSDVDWIAETACKKEQRGTLHPYTNKRVVLFHPVLAASFTKEERRRIWLACVRARRCHISREQLKLLSMKVSSKRSELGNPTVSQVAESLQVSTKRVRAAWSGPMPSRKAREVRRRGAVLPDRMASALEVWTGGKATRKSVAAVIGASEKQVGKHWGLVKARATKINLELKKKR